MTVLSLDKVDRLILSIVEHDARISMSALARRLKQGRDRVEYRVTRLVEEGVIRKFTTLIDPAQYGWTIFKSYLKLCGTRQRIELFSTYLRNHERVFGVMMCDGRWDLIFTIATESVFSFHAEQSAIFSKFADLIVSFEVYAVSEYWFYPRRYLIGGSGNGVHLGGQPKIPVIDTLDQKLIRLLSANARMPLNELAERIDTTTVTVAARLDRLLKDKVLLSLKADLDREKLAVILIKSQLFLREYSAAAREALSKYCGSTPSVVAYIEQVGNCSTEIEFEVEGYDQYHQIIGALRNSLPQFVASIETTFIKESYLKWSNLRNL